MQEIPETLAYILQYANVIKEKNNPQEALEFLKGVDNFNKILEEVIAPIREIAKAKKTENTLNTFEVNKTLKNEFVNIFLNTIQGVFNKIKLWQENKYASFYDWAVEYSKTGFSKLQIAYAEEKLQGVVEPENLIHAVKYLDTYYTAVKKQSLSIMIERVATIAKKVGTPEFLEMVCQLETEIVNKIKLNLK